MQHHYKVIGAGHVPHYFRTREAAIAFMRENPYGYGLFRWDGARGWVRA